MIFLGKAIMKNNFLYLITPGKQEAFKLNGHSAMITRKILSIIRPGIDSEQISKKADIPLEKVNTVLDNLKEIGLLKKINGEENINVLIITNFNTEIINSYTRSRFSKLNVVNMDTAKEEQNSGTYDYIIGFSTDTDEKLFELTDSISKSFQVPWIRFALSDNHLYIGPMFFHDGGPCYTCYTIRKRFNNSNIEFIFNYYNSIELSLPFLSYIIKGLQNKGSDVNILASREHSIDFLDLKTKNTRILRMPNCPKCINHRHLGGIL